MSLLACGASEQGKQAPVLTAGNGGGAGAGGALGGAGGSKAGTAGQGPVMAVPHPASGDWLLLGFEDPVAVHLAFFPSATDGGYSVAGPGCFAGPQYLGGAGCPDAETCDCCGLARGTAMERQVSFVIPFSPTPAVYGADAYVSEDGTRLAGSFFSGLGGAASPFSDALLWLRLEEIGFQGSSCAPWRSVPASIDEQLLQRVPGDYMLESDTPVGWLEPGQPIRVRSSTSPNVLSLSGGLGTFWNPDFAWDEATRKLTAGPVPETVPGMPVQLTIQFAANANAVTEIIASTAEGESGRLVPMPAL